MNLGARFLLVLVGTSFCLHQAQANLSLLFTSIDYDNEASPSKARNLRAEARYHWMLANTAQNQMLAAENDDDVDRYEKFLEKMREEDRIWRALGERYDQLRDLLEAKIRNGELTILGFTERHVKGKIDSAIDHVLFKART